MEIHQYLTWKCSVISTWIIYAAARLDKVWWFLITVLNILLSKKTITLVSREHIFLQPSSRPGKLQRTIRHRYDIIYHSVFCIEFKAWAWLESILSNSDSFQEITKQWVKIWNSNLNSFRNLFATIYSRRICD